MMDDGFISQEEFDSIPDGAEMTDWNGLRLFKVKGADLHHTWDSVFDPRNGTICHMSEFLGLKLKEDTANG